MSTSFQKMYDTPGAFFVEHVPRDARDVLRASIIELILGMLRGWVRPIAGSEHRRALLMQLLDACMLGG